MPCRFAQPAEEADPPPGPMLCGWAEDAAPEKLMDVPRWLQRNARAGHLLRFPEDCKGCPVRQEA
jgi:hypothetical protein